RGRLRRRSQRCLVARLRRGRHSPPRRVILPRSIPARIPGTNREADVRGLAMMRRYNRLLVAFFVISDSLLGMAAFLVAYLLRFESGLPVFKGYPPFANYLRLAPFIGLLVPLA